LPKWADVLSLEGGQIGDGYVVWYIYIILCNAYTDIYIYIAVLWYSRVQPRNQESPKITDLMLRFGGVWFQTHALPDLRWFGRGFRLQQRRRSGWRHV
jgi:hypothetical protein